MHTNIRYVTVVQTGNMFTKGERKEKPNMASYPIEDIREIHKIWKGVNVEFDPKVHSIAVFIERLNMRIKEMNVILDKYFG